MYNWGSIAARTEAVYTSVMAGDSQNDVMGRLTRLRACGQVFGLFAILFAFLDHLWLRVIEWWDPANQIDIAPTLPLGMQAHVQGKSKSTC